MTEEMIQEEDDFLEQMGGLLCSHVRQLIKDESVIVRIVKESFESMRDQRVRGKDNIKSYLVSTAHSFSLNYLKSRV